MPEGYFFFFIKEAALCIISSEGVSLLKEYSMKRHYETNRASQFTGLQDLLTVTEASTIKQSCLLSHHKECTRMSNISDPILILSE